MLSLNKCRRTLKAFLTKTKSTTSKILLIAMALIMVLGALVALPITSSAATNRAGVYTISGTYTW